MRKKRVSFSVEIFARYKNQEKQKLNTFALVDDTLYTKHELNEEMFLNFVDLVQQEQTDYKALDDFLKENSLELKKLRAEAEAKEIFDNYETAVSFGNDLQRGSTQKKK